MAFEPGKKLVMMSQFVRLKPNMSTDELNESMPHFLFEIKKQDGQEYPTNSLHGLVCGIQRYLKTQCGKISIFSMMTCFTSYVERFMLL